jgi:hypothetical protein
VEMGQVTVYWSWLKKLWGWSKIHWKFFLGISIPIAISILVRKGNSIKVYKKATDIRNQQLETLEKVHALEINRKGMAQKEFLDASERILKEHEQALDRIANEEQDTLNEIDSAEKATEAIRRKLEE